MIKEFLYNLLGVSCILLVLSPFIGGLVSLIKEIIDDWRYFR